MRTLVSTLPLAAVTTAAESALVFAMFHSYQFVAFSRQFNAI
jgi:hypothetical protein